MSSPSSDVRRIRDTFMFACLTELRALKPGNVHAFADGHRMTVRDFERSAEAAAEPLCRPRAEVGERIRGAVAASWAAVGCNTNLGIILLAAPLVAAAEIADAPILRERVAATLDRLTVDDAIAAYAAIAMARPAGLGRIARQDIAEQPTVTLKEAMRLASDRDRIALQYVTVYEDIFTFGVPRLRAAAPETGIERATTLAYMDFLAAFPDSHIQRKHGAAIASEVLQEAGAVRRAIMNRACTDDIEADLLAFDRSLKSRGINPGTSADLTVASLLVLKLENGLVCSAR